MISIIRAIFSRYLTTPMHSQIFFQFMLQVFPLQYKKNHKKKYTPILEYNPKNCEMTTQILIIIV